MREEGEPQIFVLLINNIFGYFTVLYFRVAVPTVVTANRILFTVIQVLSEIVEVTILNKN